tara:strand:- start:55 stop:594 length:540 start_codon:yes stop_codon:yes gene_type:complete
MDDLDKYTYIKDILSNDERELLFNYVKLFNKTNITSFCTQTPLHETIKYGDPVTDALLQSKKQIFEKASNLELIEAYSFWRLYKKFSSLEKHVDRKSCEVTISVNIKADREWPLFIGGERIIIKPGDGVLYFGEKLEHWREEYDGDYSLQVFFHYVLKNGRFKHLKWDGRQSLGMSKIG